MRGEVQKARGKFLRFFLGTGAMVVLALTWSIASPPMSSPDDSAHLTTIWCAWGDWSECKQTSVAGEVFVPQSIAMAPCFALDAGQSARCVEHEPKNLVSAVGLQGYNASLYYITMRAFVSDSATLSVLRIRWANIALALMLWVAAYSVSTPVARGALVAVWTILMIPMGLFFIPSTNPSSWLIISAGVSWAFVLRLLKRPFKWDPSVALAGLGLAISTVVALGGRTDGVLVLGISIVTATFVAWPWKDVSRVHRAWLLVLIFAVALGGLFYIMGTRIGQLFSQLTTSWDVPSNSAADQPNALAKTLLELPSFLAGFMGNQSPVWTQRSSESDGLTDGYASTGFTYGLGYTDVQMPFVVFAAILGVAFGLAIMNVGSISRRYRLALLIPASSLICGVLLTRLAFGFGLTNIQPRYFFPTFLILGAFTFLGVQFRLNNFQIVTAATTVTLASSLALRATMGRYTHGQAHTYLYLTEMPRWWWHFGPSPDLTWIIGTIAGLVVAMVVVRSCWKQSSTSVDELEPFHAVPSFRRLPLVPRPASQDGTVAT